MFIFFLDDLPVAPGMSAKLKIKQNTTTSINATKTIAEDEWAEDISGFWDDEVSEVVNQFDAVPEPILINEINHIKVITKY